MHRSAKNKSTTEQAIIESVIDQSEETEAMLEVFLTGKRGLKLT